MRKKTKRINISDDSADYEEAKDLSFDSIQVGGDTISGGNNQETIDLDTPIDLADAVAAAGQPRPVQSAGTSDTAPNNGMSGGAQVQELTARLEQANSDHLRALADFQNFKRRTDENIARRVREGQERLIRELLPVLDDFDFALAAAKQAQSYEQLVGGIEAVARKFQETLAKQGVVPISARGEPFDPDLHDAVMVDPDTDQPDETVTEELRKGYRLGDKVIRPTLVKVAKAG